MAQDYIASLLGQWSADVTLGSVFFRILLSMLLSAIIGTERASMPWMAAAVVVSAALVSGYSILFSSSGTIQGLTTSAGLWTCSVIGLAIGMGMYTIALLSFAALLLSLSLFPAIEKASGTGRIILKCTWS